MQHYTHKKILLNADELHILTITKENLPRYMVPEEEAMFKLWREIDWTMVRKEGFDGVHIPQTLIDNAMNLYVQYLIQFGSYDVETLVVWGRKEKLRWSEPRVRIEFLFSIILQQYR